jgi:hypothetical protein
VSPEQRIAGIIKTNQRQAEQLRLIGRANDELRTEVRRLRRDLLEAKRELKRKPLTL